MPPSTLVLDDGIGHDENRIEFEVLSSGGGTPSKYNPISANSARRPFSIDLSLELERQLELESQPNTSTHPEGSATGDKAQRESLDPHVLAHIVTQLQQSLAGMSKERDDLLNLLSKAHAKEAELTDALQHMTDKVTGMEEELSEARRKNKDDEEAINMLRTKVEESRRGLMRLQQENRRRSIQPIDLSRAGISFEGTFSSNKRASFTPLTGSFTGRSHTRGSSISDSGVDSASLNLSPGSQFLSLADSTTSPGSRSGRLSGLFGRPVTPPEQAMDADALKKEVLELKEQLQVTKHELAEAIEAREASETCVKALREFIGENKIGADAADGGDTSSLNLKLPPLPAATTGEEEDTAKKSALGWNFPLGKLWRVDTATIGQVQAPSPAASPVVVTTPSLSKKLGGFFGGRGSVSSAQPPQLQSNGATKSAPGPDSVHSSSDTSSVNEPESPAEEGGTNSVKVWHASDVGSASSSPDDLKEIKLEP